MLTILVIVSILLILAALLILALLNELRKPLFSQMIKLERPEDVPYEVVNDGTVLYEVVHGNVISMQDFKNSVAVNSEIIQIENGKAIDFEFKFNFETGIYDLKRNEKNIDSTDDFY